MKLKWLTYLVPSISAMLLIGSVSAFAKAKPPVVVQTPLSPTKIPQFAQPLDLLDLGGLNGVPVALGKITALGIGSTNIDVSICEFQSNILPPGTPVVGAVPGVAPATWVWGYQVNAPGQQGTCNNGLLPHSYLGPVVVAERHTPTQMTFYNRLPDANQANVMAYATSTDQTLIWGDPVGLNISPPPLTKGDSFAELNDCWHAAQTLVPPLLMPAACNNNYGFIGPQVLPIPPVTPAYTAPVPAAVHIHGGEVPSVLDGGPDAWWTPNGIAGHGFYTRTVKSLPGLLPEQPALPDADYPPGSVIQVDKAVYENLDDLTWTASVITPFSEGTLVLNEADGLNYAVLDGVWRPAAKDRASYVYPNGQEAAAIWFHDHMLGATRLNVYAGIAGGYVLIDPDTPLAAGLHPLGLNDPVLGTDPLTDPTLLTVPLIIQDRMFDTNGQLYFPNVGINPEHPFWVPEFVGDTIVVNGKAWPFFNVQPKRYRFIFLNGSNARAYELFLLSKTTGLKGPSLWVIGNDQGYLDAPQQIDPLLPGNGKLTMMPGERYEVIIDFSTVAGQVIEMQNTARTPWVGGAPVNGTTTGRIMRFNVAAATPGFVDNTYNPALPGQIRPPMNRLTTPLGTTPAAGVTIHKTRRLTVNEVIAAGGPLEVLVNNTLYDGSKPRPAYTDPVTGANDFTPITSLWNTSYYSELPYEGETELWEILNLTADAHPMHPHLVGFQVLNRQALDVKGYLAAYNAAYAAAGLPIDGAGPPFNYNNSGSVNPLCSPTAPGPYTGPGDPYAGLNPLCVLGGNPDPAATLSLIGLPVPPARQEIGWKDTVQALPGMVTRILVRFAKPDLPVDTAPTAAGYDFSPNHGHGYVWHCHIVDHEDNEMMRPFSVTENPAYPHNYVMGLDY